MLSRRSILLNRNQNLSHRTKADQRPSNRSTTLNLNSSMLSRRHMLHNRGLNLNLTQAILMVTSIPTAKAIPIATKGPGFQNPGLFLAITPE